MLRANSLERLMPGNDWRRKEKGEAEDEIDSIADSIDMLLLFSCSVVSNSLWPHGLQHTRPPCPSPSPGTYLNLCSSSQWCHPTILSSVIHFSSCLQSFTASGSFLSQLFASDAQSVEALASASVPSPVIIQDWFPLEFTGLISLQSKGLWRVFSNMTVQKHQFFNRINLCLSKLGEIVEDREAWYAAVHEVTKSQTWVSIELNWNI